MFDLSISLLVKRLLLSGDHSTERYVTLLQRRKNLTLFLKGRRRLVGMLTLTSLMEDWILVLALQHAFKDHSAL